jgi:hypothetical protein
VIVILGAILGMWWASGTTYMQTLVVDGELQINKVLPVLFGGAAVLGLVITCSSAAPTDGRRHVAHAIP